LVVIPARESVKGWRETGNERLHRHRPCFETRPSS
jgi:hypothetical protein